MKNEEINIPIDLKNNDVGERSKPVKGAAIPNVPFTDSNYIRFPQNNLINNLTINAKIDKKTREGAMAYKEEKERIEHENRIEKAKAETLNQKAELKPLPTNNLFDYKTDIGGKYYFMMYSNLQIKVKEEDITDIDFGIEALFDLFHFLKKYMDGTNVTENGIILDIEEYRELIGEKNLHRTKIRIANTIRALSSIIVRYEPTKKTKFDIPFNASILSATPDINTKDFKNKNAYIGFTPEFLAAMNVYEGRAFTTLLPKSAYKINAHRKPHALYLAYYICTNRRKNEGKRRANYLRIRTLADACPNLPKQNEIKNYRYKQSVIDPFFDNLSELDFIRWHIENEKGEELTTIQQGELTIDEFYNCFIIIDEWIDYPNDEEYKKNTPAKKKEYINKKIKERERKNKKKN